jgi:hypothetical protein
MQHVTTAHTLPYFRFFASTGIITSASPAKYLQLRIPFSDAFLVATATAQSVSTPSTSPAICNQNVLHTLLSDLYIVTMCLSPYRMGKWWGGAVVAPVLVSVVVVVVAAAADKRGEEENREN